MMVRRVGAFAAGLAAVASFGLAGTGAASAVAPAIHIRNGAEWTLVIRPHNFSGCEVETFASNGTFKGDTFHDSGTWSGGDQTLSMTWTKGSNRGISFHGTFMETSPKEYKGQLDYSGSPGPYPGVVVKGAMTGC